MTMSVKGLGTGLVVVGVLVVCFLFIQKMATQPGPLPAGPSGQTSTYTSRDGTLAFAAPQGYDIAERADSFEGNPISVITLIPKGAVIPDMSEGPPDISVLIVPNPENLSLDEWIRAKSVSNWQLSNQGETGASTVGGEAGLGYTYSGLYENTAVAVAHGSNVYLFSVGTIAAEDQIKKDFLSLLNTVQFR
jgi:hypothetical protein